MKDRNLELTAQRVRQLRECLFQAAYVDELLPSILASLYLVQEALETPRVSLCSPFGIHVCVEKGV